MPCCIERMRFSPRLAIRKNNKLLFFHFIFFCRTRDLFVSGFVRVARHHHPGLGCCAEAGRQHHPGLGCCADATRICLFQVFCCRKPPGWTCLQNARGRNYLSRRGTVENHTFSAFWLRSSVVSVLISLISGTWRMASHEFK